ncbi:hypothetical protein FK220_018925 [Flavobacteriaceae bacterium TP-CH-4]|uniref:Uncharacterized protein n=1 Tax=Pelagihabitans pacificus TaxID=2696054 RepID=A0A967AWZ3_9FLAO|nr:hypothetical protein [Pelagihabitans pacificus]NHF61434.1 hypothetical protein [Pelagihabitans pacificus]
MSDKVKSLIYLLCFLTASAAYYNVTHKDSEKNEVAREMVNTPVQTISVSK